MAVIVVIKAFNDYDNSHLEQSDCLTCALSSSRVGMFLGESPPTLPVRSSSPVLRDRDNDFVAVDRWGVIDLVFDVCEG